MSKLSFFFVLLAGLSFGQKQSESFLNFYTDFRTMWEQQPRVHFTSDVSTVLYQDISKKVVISQEKGKMKSGELNWLMYTGKAQLYLQNTAYGLMLDSAEHVVYLTPVKNIQSAVDQWKPNLSDSSKYTVSKVMQQDDIIFRVTEKTRLSGFEQMTFTFDKKSGILRKLGLEYWPSNFMSDALGDTSTEKPYLEMLYDTHAALNNNADISKVLNEIIVVTGTSVALAKGYEQFKLQDLRTNQTSK